MLQSPAFLFRMVPANTLGFAMLLGVAINPAHLNADSIAPVDTGAVVDHSPQDGLGDRLDRSLIANANGTQYRAIVEYDLSSAPAGTVLSASLTGRVGPNNSVDVGIREHLVEVYTGNGLVDLSDYSVPGIEVGRFSHESGGSTEFEFDFTGILHNLLAAGADYVGMRVSPLTNPLPFDALSTDERFPDAPRLNFEILPEGARTDQLLPFLDFGVDNSGGSPTLEEGSLSIPIQRVDFADVDRRGVLEYDISDIPANAIITDAKIEFDLRSAGGGSGETTDAPMYGFAGDGVASTADAFEASTEIGILGPVEGLDPITVDVDHQFIQSLLGTTDYFGIAILGDPDFNSVSFATNEFQELSSTVAPAQLFLTYTVPANPADFNGDEIVDGVDLAQWVSSYGANAEADADGDEDTDGLDFLQWQRSVSSLSTLHSAVAVPEPGAMSILVAAGLMCSAGSRGRSFKCNRFSAVESGNFYPVSHTEASCG